MEHGHGEGEDRPGTGDAVPHRHDRDRHVPDHRDRDDRDRHVPDRRDRDDGDRDDRDRDGYDGDGRDGEGRDRAGHDRRPRTAGDLFSRFILWAAAVVVGLALVAIAAAYLPGWWADRVTAVVAGNRIAGVLGGFVCGALFVILPLLVLRAAARRGIGLRERLVRLVIAVLLAVPDLLTLGAVSGGGTRGAAARAELDARGPGFTAGSLAGALLGAAAVVATWVLLADRRRHVHELHDLRTELRLRDTPTPPAAPSPDDPEPGPRA